MKKVLIISFLNFIFLQNESFATIQPNTTTVEKQVASQKGKPRLSFKQRLFTTLMQRKMRHLNAKQPVLFVQKDSSEPECVIIKLKNGNEISARIVSMDDKNIKYIVCDFQNPIEKSIPLSIILHIKNNNNQLIFDNRIKNSQPGVVTGAVSIVSWLLTILLFLYVLPAENVPEWYAFVILAAALTSLVTGILSLRSRALSRNKYPTAFAVLVVIPIFFLAFLLLLSLASLLK